jgi:hypothetical protein
MIRVLSLCVLAVCASAKPAFSLFRKIPGGFAQAVANLPLEDGEIFDRFAPSRNLMSDTINDLRKYAEGDSYSVVAFGELDPPSGAFKPSQVWFHRGGKRDFSGLWQVRDEGKCTQEYCTPYSARYLNTESSEELSLSHIDFACGLPSPGAQTRSEDGIICHGTINQLWSETKKQFYYALSCDGIYTVHRTFPA